MTSDDRAMPSATAALAGSAPSPAVSAVPAPAAIAQTCENCRFGKLQWRKGEKYSYFSESSYENREGERSATHILCRRRPPVMVPEWGWSFPSMDDTDWCGEHEAPGQ